MGERKLAAVKAMNAVAGACQDAIGSVVDAGDDAMRVRTPGGRVPGALGSSQIKAIVANVRHGLQLIVATAPQLSKTQRWFALVRYIVERILACAPKPSLGLTALKTG